jgi:hypothetical protein
MLSGMKQLLIVLSLAATCEAALVTVPFSAVVTEVSGAPFGIQAQVGVTPVTGFFTYDTTTPSDGTCVDACQFFAVAKSNPAAFSISFGGNTITSSDFTLLAANGKWDAFRASAESDGYSYGGEFLINGIRTDGAATIFLNDNESEMFSAEAQPLPTREQLRHVDLVLGWLSNSQGGVSFQGSVVPEPCAILLVAQSLCVLGFRRKRSACSGEVLITDALSTHSRNPYGATGSPGKF